MKTFLWISDGESKAIIYANNEEKAYEIIIKERMKNCDKREDAEKWFEQNDMIVSLDNLPILNDQQ